MNKKTLTRPVLESRYSAAAKNLYLVAAFTAVNLILIMTNTDMYFLFSANIPFVLTALSRYFCGMMPAESYAGLGDIEFWPASFFYVALTISILSIALYVLAGILSNKHRVGWLIAALVMFSLDTVFMVWYYGIDMSIIIDMVFHVWVLVILIQGIAAHYKLKKMPPEEITAEAVDVDEAAAADVIEDADGAEDETIDDDETETVENPEEDDSSNN